MLIGSDWMGTDLLRVDAPHRGNDKPVVSTQREVIRQIPSQRRETVTPTMLIALCDDLPPIWKSRLDKLLRNYLHVFRKEVLGDPAANVVPCCTRLKPGVVP